MSKVNSAQSKKEGMARLSQAFENSMDRRRKAFDDLLAAFLRETDKHKLDAAETLLHAAMLSQYLADAVADLGMSAAEINAMDAVANENLGILGLSMGDMGDDDDDDMPNEDE